MKRTSCAVLLAVLLTPPALALADEGPVPTEQEVLQAEGTPPLIPHAPYEIRGKEGDATCLVCHEEGINNAPQTPHAERRGCTQCHVQGEVKKNRQKKVKGPRR